MWNFDTAYQPNLRLLVETFGQIDSLTYHITQSSLVKEHQRDRFL